MMSLSQTTGHAVRALACLAGCTTPPASIKDVSHCAGVPQPYLAKIVKRLNEAGIVASKRGSKGGIWLARPARLISLYEVAEAVEGSDFLGSCLYGFDACSDARDCPVHGFWVKTRDSIRRELVRTKLSDVLDFYLKQGRLQMEEHQSG